MGGGDRVANVTPCAEFNIWADPEAAEIVTTCGAKVTWVPLDATHAAYITQDDCEELKKIGTPASVFAADLIERRIKVHDYAQPLEVKHSCALHDPLCIAYLIDPSVLKNVKYCNVEVSLSGLTEGQTCVDQRAIQENRNVYFAFDGDPKRFSKILIDAFRK